MNETLVRINPIRASALVLTLAVVAAAAAQPAIRAVLQPANERKPAPDFALKDSTGKMAMLKDYRGKVVLLDFWATCCGGCKQEIPWFGEFEKKYGTANFAVVGVSMDQGGWNVVKPFLAASKVPYRMLLGDDPTARQFAITNLPDTFLIDASGRVATAYRGGIVDKDDVETNIKALLSER